MNIKKLMMLMMMAMSSYKKNYDVDCPGDDGVWWRKAYMKTTQCQAGGVWAFFVNTNNYLLLDFPSNQTTSPNSLFTHLLTKRLSKQT